MLHETLPFKVEDWQSFYEKYSSEYVDGYYGRFLVKRSRIEGDLTQYLNNLARAYKKAQSQHDVWRKNIFLPLLDSLEEKATGENGKRKVIAHAKPIHQYTGDQSKWWEYNYSESSSYGWGYSFNWIDEPKKKINHDLGQKLYELDNYQKKFHNRIGILRTLLESVLIKHLYKLYDYKWLDKNQFPNKLVKFTLLGDEYWYRIGYSRHGMPIWENFIWQSNNMEEINL